MFIDFDKDNKSIYINYYLDNYKLGIKITMKLNDELKIDELDLSKYTYLIHYE